MKFFRGLLIVLFFGVAFMIGFYLPAPRKVAVFLPLFIGLVLLGIYSVSWRKEEKKSLSALVVSAILAIPIGIFMGYNEYREPTTEEKAMSYVKNRLKDPYSAQFRNQRGFCGEVNAKNAMGAYTGYKRYVASSDYAVYFETDSQIDTSENRVEQVLFEEDWAKYCR